MLLVTLPLELRNWENVSFCRACRDMHWIVLPSFISGTQYTFEKLSLLPIGMTQNVGDDELLVLLQTIRFVYLRNFVRNRFYAIYYMSGF